MKKEKYNKWGQRLIAGFLAMMMILTTVFTNNVVSMAAASAVTLSSKSETIAVGKSVQLKVKSVKGLKSKAVTWKSSNSKVAKVTAKGKVTGVTPGNAKITAISKSNKKVKATCKITVKKDAVQSIKVDKTACVIVKGKSTKVKVVGVEPSTASSKVTWKINKTSIGKLTVKGNTATVKGKKAGKATLTATTTDGSKKTVKVDIVVVNKKADIKKVSEVKVSLKQEEIFTGETTTAQVVVSPKQATLKRVFWSVDNKEIAEIDQTGKITGLKAGTVKITATSQDGSGKKATVTLTVKDKSQPTVIPTKAPEGTATVIPTKAPEGTATVIPTKAPEGTATVIPTKAPEGTATVIPTKVPEGTATVIPTKAPEGTATVIPTKAPEGTATVIPTKAPEGTVTVVPTKQPEITEIPTETWCESIEDAGKVVREEMKKRSETIKLNYKTREPLSDGSMLNEIVEEALIHTGVSTEGDYLKWHMADWNATVEGTMENNVNYLTIIYSMNYYTNNEQETEVDVLAAALQEQLSLQEKNDYQKIKAIYDYICSSVAYDYKNLNDESYMLKYTAYAALVNRSAVCQGYANLLYRLLLEAGIDCRIITGISNGEAHAWNIVKLDGTYYYLDSTWDAQREKYSYFLMGTTDFDSHTSSEEYMTEEFQKAYPIADKKYQISEIEEKNVITLYKNGEIKNSYASLEEAFAELEKEYADYKIEISDSEVHHLPKDLVWPNIKSLTLCGVPKEEGENVYCPTVGVYDDCDITSTITFENIGIVPVSKDITINVNDNKITLQGHCILGNYSGFIDGDKLCNVSGEQGSLILGNENNYSQIEINGSVNVKQIYGLNGAFTQRLLKTSTLKTEILEISDEKYMSFDLWAEQENKAEIGELKTYSIRVAGGVNMIVEKVNAPWLSVHCIPWNEEDPADFSNVKITINSVENEKQGLSLSYQWDDNNYNTQFADNQVLLKAPSYLEGNVTYEYGTDIVINDCSMYRTHYTGKLKKDAEGNFVYQRGQQWNLNADEVSAKVNDTGKIEIIAESGMESVKEIVYSSGDEEIVSVDENGNYNAKKAGTTLINVKITYENGNEVLKTCVVKVKGNSGDNEFRFDEIP